MPKNKEKQKKLLKFKDSSKIGKQENKCCNYTTYHQ